MSTHVGNSIPRRAVARISALALLAAGIALGFTPAPAVAAPGAPIASWGDNGQGQLGVGSTTSSTPAVSVLTTGALAGKTIVQVAAGVEHACAVTSDGALACWGDNTEGQIGNGGGADVLAPLLINGGSLAGKSVTQVSAGLRHTCALTSDGAVSCWGRDAEGQLGNGAAVATTVPGAVFAGGVLAGKTVTQVSAGGRHTCAVAAGGAYCWGENARGQVGDTTTLNRDVPVGVYTGAPPFVGFLSGKTVTQISAGGYATCARTSDGGLGCWGMNQNGQLGVASVGTCGGDACSLVPLAVVGGPLPGSGVLAGQTIAQVSLGYWWTCAITSAGAGTCWGDNTAGGIGDGTMINRPLPVFVATPPGGALAGKTLTQISTGVRSVCARASDGTLACWGHNNLGQLGVPASEVCFGQSCSTVPLSLTGVPGSGVVAGSHALQVSVGGGFAMAIVVSTPGAPTAVTATVGDGTATVTWTPPTSDGGAAITAYSVERSTDGGATWAAAAGSPVAAPATTLALSGLTNGVPITFRVAAANAAGIGSFSAPSVPVVPVVTITKPGPVTGLTAASPRRSRVVLTWAPPIAGSPVTGYQYRWRKSGRGWSAWRSTTGTTATIKALSRGARYTFRVRALNTAGASAASSVTLRVRR